MQATDDTTEVPFEHELSDDDIRDAIRANAGPVKSWAEHDIPGDTDPVALVREALAWMQSSVAEHYQQIRTDEAVAVVEETDSHVVFATGEDCVPRRDINEHSPYDVAMLGDIVNTLHHQLAREMTDYDWGYSYPLVVNTDELSGVQIHPEPPADKDHWVPGDDGTMHIPAANHSLACGRESTQKPVHYRQINIDADVETEWRAGRVCDECIEHINTDE